MKIHQYQAKNIFAKFGMPVQDGYVFENIEDQKFNTEKHHKQQHKF